MRRKPGTLDEALNECMGRYRVYNSRTAPVSVTLEAFPQCRGEGASILQALQDARCQFSCLQDCRVSWAIEALLADGAL